MTCHLKPHTINFAIAGPKPGVSPRLYPIHFIPRRHFGVDYKVYPEGRLWRPKTLPPASRISSL